MSAATVTANQPDAPVQTFPPVVAPTPFQSASLYVGDLSPDVTEAMLYDVFQPRGPVAFIRVCRDSETRRSLGYAYVNFQSPADAETALDTMNYCLIKDRPCRLMWSRRDPSIRKSGVGNVFIRNLCKNIDNKALFDTLSSFGNILSCHVATDKVTQKSKGFAFVHYETKAAADAAIKGVNNMLLNDRKVFVGEFKTRRERDAELGVEAQERPFRNLFIKNLDKSITQEKLKELFAPFGELDSVVVMMSNRVPASVVNPHQMGFVSFKDHKSAKAAKEEMHEKEVEGLKLFVAQAQRREDRQLELRRQNQRNPRVKSTLARGFNLYVKNLDDSVTDEVFKREFLEYGPILSSRVMMDESRPHPKSKGFGFVSYEKEEDSKTAMQKKSGTYLGSKLIYVCVAQTRQERNLILQQKFAQGAWMPGGPQYNGAWGRPPYAPYPAQVMYANPPYAQQQMPRTRWAQVAPTQVQQQMQNRGYQQQYPMMGMPPQPQGAPQRGGNPNQRQQRRPGPPAGGSPNAGQQVNKGQYNLNQKARNAGPTQDAQAYAQNEQTPIIPSNEELDAQALAAAPNRQQKQMLGERLYPLVQQIRPDLAGKITGMLLEIDNSELLHFLQSPEALRAKVAEAVDALHQHMVQSGQGVTASY